MSPLGWLVLLFAPMSIVTLIMYGLDKAAARKKTGRISERSLLLCGLACGWPGAILAQQVFRHKTRKPGFRLLFFATIILNVVMLAALFAVI